MTFEEWIDVIMDDYNNWSIVEMKVSPTKKGLSFKYQSIEVVHSILEDVISGYVGIDSLIHSKKSTIKSELVNSYNTRESLNIHYIQQNRENTLKELLK